MYMTTTGNFTTLTIPGAIVKSITLEDGRDIKEAYPYLKEFNNYDFVVTIDERRTKNDTELVDSRGLPWKFYMD